MKPRPTKTTKELSREAQRAGERCKTLADGLRLEAKGMGRVVFEGGVPTWYPLTVKTS